MIFTGWCLTKCVFRSTLDNMEVGDMIEHRISDDDRRRIVCIRLPTNLVREVDSLILVGERSKLIEELLNNWLDLVPPSFDVKGNTE